MRKGSLRREFIPGMIFLPSGTANDPVCHLVGLLKRALRKVRGWEEVRGIRPQTDRLGTGDREGTGGQKSFCMSITRRAVVSGLRDGIVDIMRKGTR